MAKLARNPRFKVRQGTGESHHRLAGRRAAEAGQTIAESPPSAGKSLDKRPEADDVAAYIATLAGDW
jgi:hypothetical protein